MERGEGHKLTLTFLNDGTVATTVGRNDDLATCVPLPDRISQFHFHQYGCRRSERSQLALLAGLR